MIGIDIQDVDRFEVYVGSDKNHAVYALNAKNGKLIWETTTGGGVISSPAVANGIVYVGSNDHKLYALNATTGKKIWTYTTDGEVGSPVVKYGVVYIGSSDHKVYALNAQTGKKIWTHTTDDNTIPGPKLAVADGIVYTASNDGGSLRGGVLYALSAANGKKLWSYQIDEMITSHVIVDNTIYLTTMNDLYAFSTITPTTTTAP